MTATMPDHLLCLEALKLIPKLEAMLEEEHPASNKVDRMMIAAISIARIIADTVGDEHVPITFNTWAAEFRSGSFPIGPRRQ